MNLSGCCHRPFAARVETAVRQKKEEHQAELQQNLRQADLAQLLAKLESDFAILDSVVPKASQEAELHALDMKYLRDRQERLALQRRAIFSM